MLEFSEILAYIMGSGSVGGGTYQFWRGLIRPRATCRVIAWDSSSH